MIPKLLLNFFKIDICLSCRLAFLKFFLKRKIIIFILLLCTLIFLFTIKPKNNHHNKFSNKHKLCIIVPFRNRFNQLIELVPHLDQFLAKQNVNHQFLIINQIDNYRFNRASLVNVGFKISENMDCDYIAIHDVDLLPIDDRIKYHYPDSGVMHLTAPGNSNSLFLHFNTNLKLAFNFKHRSAS